MREIVFDTETTGLNPATGDRLVEIGCVELVNRVETGNSFHCYFNPQRPMPFEAEQVHGLSERFLSDKPLFADKVEELLDFIGDAPLVAHNASFDFGFLNWELGACGRPIVDMGRMVDTLQIARKIHPGAKHSLDALCSRYGIDRSHRVKHGALLDAQLLAQLYVELTGGRQIGLSIGEAVVEEVVVVATPRAVVAASRTIRAIRPHFASEEELERHKAFVEKLDAPLWLEGATG
ncbi:DNA polymerase III subunit epsilon [Sphingomonas histidinilytica]|jgi:DNA polymerase-3 subunit epsilon|uniref:DNA polymerase III subunit epsilon n=1 Tax=Rhizorhabdus histidinilytica TaxID=439228 RepID=A0A1T5DPK6_9SPHN|nr:DNA polymerase III subunit epsilon [Rhizorhabdus histidinilytica]MBO9379273.1 DNA polymerase III subunit epsilon [Rhizorhabdus histidinilytica]QEH80442.1 DNA polymerase III subunit epsilon [Sphingomonas sp. C8-2]SKB73490.1 DNA polymerase-3 subunit epsilon [Rhizorhabdus histidinilytica]